MPPSPETEANFKAAAEHLESGARTFAALLEEKARRHPILALTSFWLLAGGLTAFIFWGVDALLQLLGVI